MVTAIFFLMEICPYIDGGFNLTDISNLTRKCSADTATGSVFTRIPTARAVRYPYNRLRPSSLDYPGNWRSV